MSDKLEQFYEFLRNSTLEETDKETIRFIIKDSREGMSPLLSSRSYLFSGDVGVGKTFLAKKLLEALEGEIIYISSTALSFSPAKRCFSLKEVCDNLNRDKYQIIFIDDLGTLFSRDDSGTIIPKDCREFMGILDWIKEDPKKLWIATINEVYELEEAMVDRIEVKIRVDPPSEEHKKSFLEEIFGSYLDKRKIGYIVANSIGYNYRDLPELIKLAYRLGERKLSKSSIKRALRGYKPTQLHNLNVQNGINTTLRDIIGKERAMKTVQRLIRLYKNKTLGQRLGIRKQNLLLFYGPPGTGKTFMARALAGELGYPVINLKAKEFRNGGDGLNCILHLAKRYKNCILLVDEAEKLFGNPRYGEDNPFVGEFNREIEGIEEKEVQAIVILAMNDLSRFGEALRDRFVEVQFDLPSYGERHIFCKNKSKGTHLELDCEYLARRTEGMSFRDMEKVWNELAFYYLENRKEIPIEVIDKASRKENEEERMFG